MADDIAALRLAGISKRFGALQAVRGVSLAVAPGERRAIIGPNGAGKTTLFHVISGVHAASEGTIELFGRDVTSLPAYRRVALGLARTFQITNLFLSLTVERNVALALHGLRRSKLALLRPLDSYRDVAAETARLLDDWGLAERRDAAVRELSYGEQRTLEILLAVSQRPRLLLLDEPTAGLSPAETAAAVRLIRGLPREIAIVLIEHDMDVAFQLCDTLSVLHFGQLLVTGPRDKVRRDTRVQEIYLGEAVAE